MMAVFSRVQDRVLQALDAPSWDLAEAISQMPPVEALPCNWNSWMFLSLTEYVRQLRMSPSLSFSVHGLDQAMSYDYDRRNVSTNGCSSSVAGSEVHRDLPETGAIVAPQKVALQVKAEITGIGGRPPEFFEPGLFRMLAAGDVWHPYGRFRRLHVHMPQVTSTLEALVSAELLQPGRASRYYRLTDQAMDFLPLAERVVSAMQADESRIRVFVALGDGVGLYDALAGRADQATLAVAAKRAEECLLHRLEFVRSAFGVEACCCDAYAWDELHASHNVMHLVQIGAEPLIVEGLCLSVEDPWIRMSPIWRVARGVAQLTVVVEHNLDENVLSHPDGPWNDDEQADDDLDEDDEERDYEAVTVGNQSGCQPTHDEQCELLEGIQRVEGVLDDAQMALEGIYAGLGCTVSKVCNDCRNAN